MAKQNDFEAANEGARRLRASTLAVISARYDPGRGRVVVKLRPNLELSFPPEDVQGLENANPSDLKPIEVSPSGFGLHFPKIDADVYIPAVLEGTLGSRKWMAARLGQSGGRSKSRAKRAASKANGRLGGRPKKVATR
jgi:Protein of unknown function (DUF2442)